MLKAWRDRQLDLLCSPENLDEYRRVGEELARKFSAVDLTPFWELLIAQAMVVEAPPLANLVCDDPDDDKFLACALAGGAPLICTGDNVLLTVSGYRGIEIVTPRIFVDQYLYKS